MYSFEKRLYNDQCTVLKNALQWSMFFLKTLYNDQCTVLKNALQWSMFFLKNALQ